MDYRQPWCRECLGRRKQGPDLAFPVFAMFLTTTLRFLSSKVRVLLISHFLYYPKRTLGHGVPGPMSSPLDVLWEPRLHSGGSRLEGQREPMWRRLWAGPSWRNG